MSIWIYYSCPPQKSPRDVVSMLKKLRARFDVWLDSESYLCVHGPDPKDPSAMDKINPYVDAIVSELQKENDGVGRPET